MYDYESMIGYAYKGYTALYRLVDDTWTAYIRPPDTPEFLDETTIATREEGERLLLNRVRSAIDAAIESTDR